jgi:hypothetical protein
LLIFLRRARKRILKYAQFIPKVLYLAALSGGWMHEEIKNSGTNAEVYTLGVCHPFHADRYPFFDLFLPRPPLV